MLVLKKISTKKLAIYVFIIVLMFGGAGFLLYEKNQRPTPSNFSAIDNPTQFDKFTTVEDAVPGGEPAQNQPPIDPSRAEASKIKNNKEIDSTIFSNEKFKKLEENILIPHGDSGLGKRDLFKPN